MRSNPVEDASYDIAPDRTHATIEAAAFHAFSVASIETNTSNVDRMRVGSIVQLESGAYVWLDPETSVSSSRPVIVRTPSGRLLKYSHSEGTTDLGSARDLERITVARR